jgi:hypothetical protein
MQAFNLSGGLQSRFYGRSANALAREAGVTGGTVIRGPSGWKRLVRAIPAAGEAGEQAPRTALFKRQLDKTLPGWKKMTAEEIATTPQGRKAAAEAVELTINFGRGAYLTKAANPYILFLNASMEGMKLPLRALRDNPGARWRLAGVAAGATGLMAYNLSYPEYMDIPNNVRWGSVVVMLPSKKKDEAGNPVPNYAVVVPRTREWGAFLGPISYQMERMFADQPAEFGRFSATMAPMLSPISEFPAPELLAELAEQKANWDFYTSRPVVSQSLQNLPLEEQTTPNVSRTVELGAQALGQSPVRAQHLTSGLFGGAGKTITSVTDLIANWLLPREVEPEILAMSEQFEGIDEQGKEDFLARMNASDKRKMLNYINRKGTQIPVASAVGQRVFPGYGGQLESNRFELEESVEMVPGYWRESMSDEQMRAVDTKVWSDKKVKDARIIEKYDLAMMGKGDSDREVYRRNNPDVDTTLLLWGRVSSMQSLEAAEKLDAEIERLGIPRELVPAFSPDADGTERFPSDKALWKPYFDYYDLPRSSYLAMTKGQVEAGKLPDKYRAQWEAYQKLKTDTAKAAYRKAHPEAAKATWRDDFRKANAAFDKWLQEEEGMKALALAKKKTATTSRGSLQVRSTGGSMSFGGGAAISRRRTSGRRPSFPKPKTGMSVSAPRAPRI